MIITYKKIKVFVAHCGECDKKLMGDGSSILPYSCPCGEWESSLKRPSEYNLKS